jgi:hypothetical protein
MSYTGKLVLHWGMNTESDLAGYKVYVGTASRVYSQLTDVGLITCSTGQPAALIHGIANGVPTYVAMTAYDLTGNESTFSAEVVTTKMVPVLDVLRRVT